MPKSSRVFRVGTRGSRLALSQTRGALEKITSIINGARAGTIAFQEEVFSSPGDRDRKLDLASSPEDFFSRDLDEALREGRIDLAIHSAKDLPHEPGEGMDYVWLPWREDRRDVLVCRRGEDPKNLAPGASVGVSSPRRIAYCRRVFPSFVPQSIRGNVEERIAQLDQGHYDMIILAAAGLARLGLEGRISSFIPLEELLPPEGQGVLALSFRREDPDLRELRKLFVRPLVFAGAGIGAGNLTEDVREALSCCQICYYDALLDPAVLGYLPPEAEAVPVGKRSGKHSIRQDEINSLLLHQVRRGKRVLRLKGGDPGIFGRLAEEVQALEELRLPYRVLPGLSAFQVAAADWGILPTRRGLSRGFTVITPRREVPLQGDRGETADIGGETWAGLPLFIYMGTERAEEIRDTLMAEGRSGDEPAALLFGIGAPGAEVRRTILEKLPETVRAVRKAAKDGEVPPGLIVVGSAAAGGWSNQGLLAGRRILITSGGLIRKKAREAVRDHGGTPILLPLIELVREDDLSWARDLGEWDWIVLTSPTAARFFLQSLKELRIDLRGLPRIMTPGRETARELEGAGIYADLIPGADFGAQAMLKTAAGDFTGKRVLRLRSDRASGAVNQALGDRGAEVKDVVLYRNIPLRPERLPQFDSVFFASASAAEAFVAAWGPSALAERDVLAIGKPTEKALRALGVEKILISPKARARDAMDFLALRELAARLGLKD